MAVKKRTKRKTTTHVKRKRRRSVGVKRKPAKRKKRSVKRRPVHHKRATAHKHVTRRKRRTIKKHTTGIVSGTHKRRRKRRVVMATRPRRRRVGAADGGGLSKWLVPIALGAAAIYFLSKKTPTTPTGNYQLPPITQTQNQTRNNQSNDLINYAMAGGLAIDAIIKLIDKLNSSNDQEVQNIYDVYHTTGSLDMVYV